MRSFFIAMCPALLAFSENLGFDWGTVSATALLGWYLWYSTKITNPRHEKNVGKLQEDFRKDFSEQRDHYEQLLEELQERHAKRDEEILAILSKISDHLIPKRDRRNE